MGACIFFCLIYDSSSTVESGQLRNGAIGGNGDVISGTYTYTADFLWSKLIPINRVPLYVTWNCRVACLARWRGIIRDKDVCISHNSQVKPLRTFANFCFFSSTKTCREIQRTKTKRHLFTVTAPARLSQREGHFYEGKQRTRESFFCYDFTHTPRLLTWPRTPLYCGLPRQRKTSRLWGQIRRLSTLLKSFPAFSAPV